MSLLKRHIGRRRSVGRRVVGVAVGAALIVIGLEAPAFAVVPSVTSFTPTSGPGGCVVQITGANFTNPTVTDVDFGGVNALDFEIISDTEIWATHPAGVSGFITATNGSGTGSSTTQFSNQQPGGCAPTADTFTPTCGPPGTHVTITGTNLMDNSSDGAQVFFAPYTAEPDTGVLAPETTPATAPTLTTRTVEVPGGAASGPIGVETFNDTVGQGSAFTTTTFTVGTCITEFSPTSGDAGGTVTITGIGFEGATAVTFAGAGGTRVQAIFQVTSDTDTVDTITATVPVGAITGTIQVVAPGGTATSATDFTIGAGPPGHSRNVTLKLVKHLRLKGKVNVPDGTTDCATGVSVRLQKKKKGGGWKTLKTVTTNDTGQYKGKVKDKVGRYRALAPRTTVGDEICLKDASPVRRHRH